MKKKVIDLTYDMYKFEVYTLFKVILFLNIWRTKTRGTVLFFHSGGISEHSSLIRFTN